MVHTPVIPELRSCGYGLQNDENSFGFLRRSDEVADDFAELRRRLEEDGYLYLPGYLERQQVLDVRQVLTQRLAEEGYLAPGTAPMQAIAAEGSNVAFKPTLGQENPLLDQLLYTGKVIDLYQQLLQSPILHYDFTWVRAVAPGKGTRPHCDFVYMGRGTWNLYTAWIPYGDIDFTVGGLMVLEGSHKQRQRLRNYLQRDVDSYCSNLPKGQQVESGERGAEFDGSLSTNPASLREKLGGRWLSAEFRAGDFLTFEMGLVHASLDNRSDTIRLSTDSRYQSTLEPADERWVGPNPIGHGSAGKRGRIC